MKDRFGPEFGWDTFRSPGVGVGVDKKHTKNTQMAMKAQHSGISSEMALFGVTEDNHTQKHRWL